MTKERIQSNGVLTSNPIGHTCVFVLTRLKISKYQQPFFPILQALIHLLRQLVAFCGNEEYISFLKYSCYNGKPQKAQLPAFHILLIQLDQILSILVTIWVNYFPPAGLPLGPPPHAHQQSDSKGADLKMAARLSETSTHLHIPRGRGLYYFQKLSFL